MQQINLPHTLVLLLCFIIFIAILTRVLPCGQYNCQMADERSLLVPDSFQTVDNHFQGIGALLKTLSKDFIQAANIIAFKLFVRGAFSRIQTTGAIDAFIGRISNIYRKSRRMRQGMIQSFHPVLAVHMKFSVQTCIHFFLPLERWTRWILPFEINLIILSLILLIPSVLLQ